MKIELRNVKINLSFSQETLCFTANIYVDGKKVGWAQNEGNGGSCSYGFSDSDFGAKVENYVNALPEESIDMGNGEKMNIKPCMDFLLSDLAEQVAEEKQNQKIKKQEEKFKKQFEAKGLPIMVKLQKGNKVSYWGLKSIAHKPTLAIKLKVNPDLLIEA